MATHEISCAASALVANLLDAEVRELVEVARTRVSVHYRTGDAAVPVLCVCSPEAVRLPNSLVAACLPSPARVRLGLGRLRAAGPGSPVTTWRVRRWWRPSRPTGLTRPSRTQLSRVPAVAGSPGFPCVGAALSPETLVGLGPGLTPAGDDVLAGALVAAHATRDPRLPAWRRTTLAALDRGATTDVSRAMLVHAMDGYAVPELAGFLTALCTGRDTRGPTAALLAVGHTSGSALMAGVVHTLSTDPGRRTTSEHPAGAAAVRPRTEGAA